MMDYVLLYHETPAEWARRNDPAQANAYWGGWNAYMAAMQQAGVMKGGNGLLGPEAGATLRIADGRRSIESGTVQDGPFADTKEVLGGYVVVDVPDMDGALEWAARAPCASAGSVEVRPVLPPPPA